MTSLDISSVRDFTRLRLQRMLIDFYRFILNPIGPPNPQKIELGADHDKLITITNRYMFKDLSVKEAYTFARQRSEKPNAFLYVKLLNASKFTKKVGDYLVEFRVVRKRPKDSQTRKSASTPAGRNLYRNQSKTDLRRSRADYQAFFKSKTTSREHFRLTRLTRDKLRVLERKMRHGFDRRTHSDQSRKLSREIFQHPLTSSTVIGRASEALFAVPPNWTYCSNYELELNKTLDPTGLFLEIDVRLIEFLDINPKQAKIGKHSSLVRREAGRSMIQHS